MTVIKTYEDNTNLTDGNIILGDFPQMNNSKIIFNGKGNVLFCEKNVKLDNTVINFNSNNGLVYLGTSRFNYKLNATINENCVLSIGRNNYINGNVQIVLSEHKHVFIGSDSMISTDVDIRNADAHLIYDCNTLQRLNPTKSIFIGDHVWLGRASFVFKGTKISSGAIIGAGSVVSNKNIEHNTSYAGNPARKIKEGVFWNGCCVHPWGTAMTDNSMDYNAFLDEYFKDESVDRWIYSPVDNKVISWESIEKEFDGTDVNAKVLYLTDIYNKNNKNRFCNS